MEGLKGYIKKKKKKKKKKEEEEEEDTKKNKYKNKNKNKKGLREEKKESKLLPFPSSFMLG